MLCNAGEKVNVNFFISLSNFYSYFYFYIPIYKYNLFLHSDVISCVLAKFSLLLELTGALCPAEA